MGDSAHQVSEADRPPKRQKQMTVIACNSCKRRKSKCNGARPACDRCLRLNEQCHYELDSTISRQDGLKRRLREVEAKSDALEAVVAQLRSASEYEATDLIRQLRAGTDIRDLIDRPAHASSSRLGSVVEEENRQSYPSPPVEESSSKPPLQAMASADWRRAALSQASDLQDDGRDQSISSTRSSTPWEDNSSPLPRHHPASASTESDPPPLIPRIKRRKLGPLTVSRGYVEAFGNLPMSSSVMTGHYPTPIQRHQVANFQIPVHFLQPCWELDSSPFSRVIQDYRNLARAHFQTTPLPDLTRTDVTYFFTPRTSATRADEQVPAISTWASEMNRSFEDVDVFVRLACLYFQTRLMMWMINPTAETYASMPDLIKPTPIQMMVPHISPLDTVPLPALRETLVDDLRDWVTACAGSLSVNWPYGMDACIQKDPVDGRFYLTKEFINHACNANNWTVGSDFFKIFPELRGRVRVSDTPQAPESPISPLGADLSKKAPSPGSLRASVPESLRNSSKHTFK
ncbi:hypothetical protein MPH_04479 [Macrophomina phaseolina MS6]|uniref:Zn(2)-C6 fungal-type domain-containing protein n=1 Tax=Macrophomina phaseolina (strain MS6) TaxID=1126212 RepID=K2S7B4_MACPH|nr:hypothetical protein MPH_04479 [Macrophomina phaseolina MS6]